MWIQSILLNFTFSNYPFSTFDICDLSFVHVSTDFPQCLSRNFGKFNKISNFSQTILSRYVRFESYFTSKVVAVASEKTGEERKYMRNLQKMRASAVKLAADIDFDAYKHIRNDCSVRLTLEWEILRTLNRRHQRL